jgi:hypothetical protein
MATCALGGRTLENALGMARFTTLIPVGAAQLKARPGMIKALADLTGSENRRGKQPHQACQNKSPGKP